MVLVFDMVVFFGDFELIINSSGGDVFMGIVLVVLIVDVIDKGWKIKMMVIGLVASSVIFMFLVGLEVCM